MFAIGIDLGTTNSLACVMRQDSAGADTIKVDGYDMLPSAISIKPDGTVLVGYPARSRSGIAPTESVTSVKRLIGDGSSKWSIHGRDYTPVDVSTLLLERLREAAETYLREKVTEAVITVPAYFTAAQKRATKEAGERAGLKVLRLLPEPTAAAIVYARDKRRNQTVMVYDLGGGTFDVSILQVRNNDFVVIAVDGDTLLGGGDFDIRIARELLMHINADPSAIASMSSAIDNLSASTEAVPSQILQDRQLLLQVAERAKIELSQETTTKVIIPDILGTYLNMELTRERYNELISDLVEHTIEKMHSVLADAKLTPEDIDRIILVGGSTRNQLVRRRVTEAIKEPFIADNVDQIVAQGAATVAASMKLPIDIDFTDVTPFNLGVQVTYKGIRDHFHILVPKNSKLPARGEYTFTTHAKNQSAVDISVYQGSSERCSENSFIGGFRLTGIPQLPAGEPSIQVIFDMSDSDLLTVSATCGDRENRQTLDVNMVSQVCETVQVPSVDIQFLIDTSGSMSDELEGVRASCLDFAEKIIDSGIDCRLGVMHFDKGSGIDYSWESYGPTDPVDVKNYLADCDNVYIGKLGGCGCYIGEKNTIPVIEAFIESYPKDQNRIKIGILISDEVGNDADSVRRIIKMLQKSQLCMHSVGVPGSCHVKIAKETNGRFWDIAGSRGKTEDFSALMDDIAREITSLAIR